jgi:hypothetical protein
VLPGLNTQPGVTYLARVLHRADAGHAAAH